MNEALEKLRDLCKKHDEESHRYEKEGNLSMAIMEGVKTQCYEECFEIVNNYSKDTKIEELKHFFEVEIEKAKENMSIECNPVFNGVEVTPDKQIELNQGHIWFCRQILKMLEK